ncbi:MAG: hypothetical protein ACJATI_005373, partial [Halioglobus sp.]
MELKKDILKDVSIDQQERIKKIYTDSNILPRQIAKVPKKLQTI